MILGFTMPSQVLRFGCRGLQGWQVAVAVFLQLQPRQSPFVFAACIRPDLLPRVGNQPDVLQPPVEVLLADARRGCHLVYVLVNPVPIVLHRRPCGFRVGNQLRMVLLHRGDHLADQISFDGQRPACDQRHIMLGVTPKSIEPQTAEAERRHPTLWSGLSFTTQP